MRLIPERWIRPGEPIQPALLAITMASMLVWLLVNTVVLTVQSLHWGLTLDSPFFHFIAWRIQQGDVPYRDLADLNWPGIYLIHMAILKTVGGSDAAFRAFDLTWLAGTAALLWAFCRRFGRFAGPSAALLYCAFHISNGPTNAGQRDYFQFTFLLAGAWLVARFCESAGAWRLVLAGLALGFGISVKPHAGLLWLALAAYAAWHAHRTGKGWLLPFAAVIAGGCASLAAVALWLWRLGGLGSFFETLRAFALPVYATMATMSYYDCLRTRPLEVLASAGILIASAATRRRGVRSDLLVIGVIYGLIHYFIQKKGWGYHVYPMIGFSSALAGSWVVRLDWKNCRIRPAWVAAAVVGFIFTVGWWNDRLYEFTNVGLVARNVALAIQSDLEPVLTPGGTVQVLDTATGGLHALFRLRVKQPTRILGDGGLFFGPDTAFRHAVQADMIEKLEKSPPDAIVFAKLGFPSGRYERINSFPALRQFLETRYVVRVDKPHYRIYVPKKNP
jgi:hypothetical protein